MGKLVALIPLPLYYNPEAGTKRKQIESKKYRATARELSTRFGGGVLHRFTESPAGFWYDHGILSEDVLCFYEVDCDDTMETREWLREYSKRILVKRFRQKAIYIRLFPMESILVREEETLIVERQKRRH